MSDHLKLARAFAARTKPRFTEIRVRSAAACPSPKSKLNAIRGGPCCPKRGFVRPLFLNGLFVLLAMGAEATAADIFPVKCDLVILGQIETSDAKEFQSQLKDQLRRGCSSPRIHIYSPGGRLLTAMQIGEQIYQLRLTTVAPELYDHLIPAEDEAERRAEFSSILGLPPLPPKERRMDGPRLCRMLPGHDERVRLQSRKFDEHIEAGNRWAKRKGPEPLPYEDPGDFHPRSGVGDPRCACASACFFIWAAGSQRDGYAIQIHRPYFDPQEFGRLDIGEARVRYQELMDQARGFLAKVGVQSSIIEAMFSIDSQNARYLSVEEINSLRMAPDLSELKLAKCGPSPESLSEDRLERLRLLIERERCWQEVQKGSRQKLINEFLQSADSTGGD